MMNLNSDLDLTGHLFLHRGRVYKIEGETAKAVSVVGYRPYFDPNGMVASLHGRPEGDFDIDTKYRKSVQVDKIDPQGSLVPYKSFSFSKGQAVKRVALSKGLLFVTGLLGDYTLGYFNLQDKDPYLHPVEIPDQVKEKAFDDLLVDGQTLLAVDDIIWPKWLVLYDMSDLNKPHWTDYFELEEGVNEHIVKAEVGPYHLALFCDSFHRIGHEQYVQIYDRMDNYKLLGSVKLWSVSESDGGDAINRSLQMSFIGDKLLLSGYNSGVGVLDCSVPILEETKPKMLYYTDKSDTPSQVRDGVSLPENNVIAVWLDEVRSPKIVGMDKLYFQAQ